MTRLFLLSVLPLFVISCSASKSGESGSLTPTIYYKPTIHQNKNKCSSNDLRDMKTKDDRILITVCLDDFKLCLKQGSCFIEDNGKITSYNYHSVKNGIPRFVEVDIKRCPYGYGAKSNCLEPYFSAAADLNYHAIGDVIYIPRLIGLLLPNGELHDGYIIIRDTGGDIKGPDRFDFFTGFLDHLSKENPFARLGLGDPKNRFEYRKVFDYAEAEAARKKRNYPNLPKDD